MRLARGCLFTEGRYCNVRSRRYVSARGCGTLPLLGCFRPTQSRKKPSVCACCMYRRGVVAPLQYLLPDTCRIPLRLSALLCALHLNALATTAKTGAPFLSMTHPLIHAPYIVPRLSSVCHANQCFCDASPEAYSVNS